MKIFVLWDAQSGVIHGLYEKKEEAEAAALLVPKYYGATIEEMELHAVSEYLSCTHRYKCPQCHRCYDCGKKRLD